MHFTGAGSPSVPDMWAQIRHRCGKRAHISSTPPAARGWGTGTGVQI